MQAGDRVFVAYAITERDVTALVYPATVIAVAERGDVVVKSDHGALFTAGGPFGASQVFADEAEAWRWSAGRLRAKAETILAEAAKAEAKAADFALQTVEV